MKRRLLNGLLLVVSLVLMVNGVIGCALAEESNESILVEEMQEYFVEQIEDTVPEVEEFLLGNDESAFDGTGEDYIDLIQGFIEEEMMEIDAPVMMSSTEDLPQIFQSFISDSRWCNGAPWNGSSRPQLANYDGWSCCAYCADFTKYCFGIDDPRGGNTNVFYNANEVRAGDVLTVGNQGDGTGHWFVCLKRAGNSLYVAERYDSNVRIGWNYTISSSSSISPDRRSFTAGYHFMNETTVIENTTTNLLFSDVIYPQTFKINTTNGWNLSGGTLASNYDLKSIKSMIVDANGKTISSGTQSISGKFFSIRSLDTFSSSDNGVKFSYINAEGNYKWILIATDSNNRTLRLVMPFTAVSSGSTSTASMGKEYEDYYTVKSENVTYKVIKDVTARKTPFDNATKGSKYTKGKKVVSVAIVQNKYNNLWIKTNDNQYIYSGYHVEENDTVTVTGNQYFEVDNGGSSSSFAAALASLFILDVNAETINKPQDDTTHGGGGRTIEDSGSQQSEQWTYQVVTSDGLNMRSTPGTGGTIVATLWNPTTVAVSKKQSANNYTWGYGASSDGHTGWIVVDNNWTKLVSSETSAATHTHTPVTDAGYAATCTAEGKTDGSHCSVCGEVLTAQQTIPATGHTPVTDAGYAATCTAEGKTDGSHCSVCGEVLTVQKTIPATGHTPTIVSGYAPTCTDVGYTDGSICAVCGEVLVACQPIPAMGHSPVYVPTQAPAYQVPGYTEGSYCGVCGAVLQECVPIPALTYQELALPNVKSNGTVTLPVGEQRLLVPSFAQANGLTVTGFTSKKPAVASVDANGLLTANAEGKAKITVTTAEKKKATLTVQVVDPYKPTGIAIAEGKEVTVAVGQPLQLTAVLAPTTARATLTWTSSKPGVASVDANGLVTPLGEGKAKITVQTHNRKKAKITVKVVDPYKPDGIVIAQGKAVTLRVGEVLQLNAGLMPATAQSALAWTSKKPAVATVDANGVVTAVKKGKAKITVTTYNRKKATITVYVVD